MSMQQTGETRKIRRMRFWFEEWSFMLSTTVVIVYRQDSFTEHQFSGQDRHMLFVLRPIIPLNITSFILLPQLSSLVASNSLPLVKFKDQEKLRVDYQVLIDSSWSLRNNHLSPLDMLGTSSHAPLKFWHHPSSILTPLLDHYLPLCSEGIETPPLEFVMSTHLLLYYHRIRKPLLDSLLTSLEASVPIVCIHIIWLFALETRLSDFNFSDCC